jgi:hypothetical protein
MLPAAQEVPDRSAGCKSSSNPPAGQLSEPACAHVVAVGRFSVYACSP